MTTRFGSIEYSTPVQPLQQNPNTIKFGITTPFRRDGQEQTTGELVLLNPDQTLEEATRQLCLKWNLPDPSMYAFRFMDTDKEVGIYVTEETRRQLLGKIISLEYSPAKLCSDIIEKLRSTVDNVIISGLKDLSARAIDPTVAETFIKKNGLKALFDLIEKDTLVSEKEQGLLFAFQALLDLIFSSNTTTWEHVPSTLFSKVAAYVNTPKGHAQDRLALKPALQILESAISSETPTSEKIESEVTLPNLIVHVSNPNPKVQQSSLSLINTLLGKADLNKKKHIVSTLSSRKYRCIVLEKVVNRPGEMLSETSHELYVLQRILLNLLEDRKLTPVDDQEETLKKIKDLCHIAFDEQGHTYYGGSNSELNNTGVVRKEKPNYTKEYKKLGFQNEVNPTLDFETPPGVLALDCMYYLAKQHSETYNKIIVECVFRGANEENLLPFAKASILLTKVLCDLLKIGEPPGEEQGFYYPFFFTHDKPFEELFRICSQLVVKTWKEMRATSEDFLKVFDVVRDQIRRALDTIPESFPKLQAKLNSLTYAEIQALRARERSSREEGELQLKPIQELQIKLTPEVLKLIKQNRMNYLITGTRFNKYTSKSLVSASTTTLKRVKEKFWFCRLSNNWKVLHYGDCEEKANPMPEELANKINVVDIKELLVGKDCPHTKEKKNRNMPYAFSIVLEKEPLQSIDFIAPDERVFDLWTDGINALLGRPMESKEAKKDLEILLKMETKLRLLEIEGIEIPNEAPPIPPLPPNYNFSVLLK